MLRHESPRRTSPGSACEGPPQDPSDFLWLMTEEPHRTRRMAIIKAHPDVTRLMGHEPLTKYLVLAVVCVQLALAVLLRHTHPLSPAFLLAAYAVGGTANHNLFLAIHEITHNLAFRAIVPNRLLAVFANLPIAVPYSAAFKGYHIEHHKFLGQDGIDTDLPTRLELLCLNNVLGKVFFAYVPLPSPLPPLTPSPALSKSSSTLSAPASSAPSASQNGTSSTSSSSSSSTTLSSTPSAPVPSSTSS
ncbi:hypothetical protein C0989_006936 [Termitomyces sp. Mn162]|nr:hypothetical protein C0989_006936 [Termitomyces sp. Mn162]